MAANNNQKNRISFTKASIKTKIKMGGRVLVSQALVKENSTNLVPKIHVKRGDLVMLTSGSKEAGRGKTGKVLKVFPKTGKVIVEGLNMVTKAVKPRTALGKSGLVKEEGAIYASRVMLYSSQSKKAVRAEFRKREGMD
jgi:large subunit ribosomal protein L24